MASDSPSGNKSPLSWLIKLVVLIIGVVAIGALLVFLAGVVFGALMNLAG